jgi:glycosyltransferase involved in cell wall biosynthesis
MRIAQVAPLYESVPPRFYGGTERVVSYLTEELVAQGHDVTLFASGDSCTRARLLRACPRSLRLDEGCRDPLAHHVLLLELVERHADEFDLIHYHIDYLHLPLRRRRPLPAVTTLHGRLDLPDLQPLYREFRDVPLVSISDAQRQPLRWAGWVGTVHHGLPPGLLRFQPRARDYLAFLGRFSRDKRADRAIAIARAVGLPLKLAAKIDPADREWFETVLRPQLRAPGIEYVGEIGEHEKEAFLGNARALLFPIDWPEPFGLVLVEALACGTPVIAWRRGSVPEIVQDGVTGFLVDDLDAAIAATRAAARLDRRRCRDEFERRFTSGRMARAYLRVYERLLADQPAGRDA